MNKRPASITFLGWLFIAIGVIALLAHASEFRIHSSFKHELVWICLVQVLATVGGAFILRRQNWARWLLAAWMAFHIVLSAFHSPREFIVHTLLFGVIGYFLFRPQASGYFHKLV